MDTINTDYKRRQLYNLGYSFQDVPTVAYSFSIRKQYLILLGGTR